MKAAVWAHWAMPLRRSWDRVSVYAPLMLLGLLAFISYWMVRSTPGLGEIQEDAVQRHVPDYFMQDFSVRVYDAQGKLKNEIKGVEGKHFPDTDTIEVIQPRVRTFSLKGDLTTAVADKGIITGDGTQVQLIENAVIVRNTSRGESHREEIKSDFLHLFIDTETIRTHLPVEIVRGENDHFTSDSMVYDNLARTMQMTGRVKGVLTPGKKKAP